MKKMKTINTNLRKTKEEIIYELLLSLNTGNSFYAQGEQDRIWFAEYQYKKLVKEGIVQEIVE